VSDEGDDLHQLLELKVKQANRWGSPLVALEPKHGYDQSYVALVDRVRQAERDEAVATMRAAVAEKLAVFLLSGKPLSEQTFKYIVQYLESPASNYLTLAARMQEAGVW